MEKIVELYMCPKKFINITQLHSLEKLHGFQSYIKLYTFIVILILLTLLTIITHNKKKLSNKLSHQFNTKEFLKSIIYLLLGLILLPTLITVIIFFTLISQLVDGILKLKYGKSYGGLLKSSDAIWAIEDVSRTIINVVVLLELKSSCEDITKGIKTEIQENIFKKPETFKKLTSIRLKFLGYNFLLKNMITVDDCVQIIKMERYKNDTDKIVLQNTVSKYSNEPLPKQNNALWEILICSEAIQLNSVKGLRVPILLRFSHVLGDGLSITNFLIHTFADNKNMNFNKYIHKKYSRDRDIHEDIVLKYFTLLLDFMKQIFLFLYLVLIAPVTIMRQFIFRKAEVNTLHKSQLSINKMLLYTSENSEKFISLVKDAKRAMPGSTFSDILLTAISGSLEDHFRQNSYIIPQFLTAVVPAVMAVPTEEEQSLLQNQFSVAMLDLPILTESKSMIKKLEMVMKKTNLLRNSPDYKVNYLILNLVCGVLPEPLLRYGFKTDKVTISLSSVPGVNKLSVLNECNIEDIIFFLPHRGTAGLGLSILTYDNRFQLGLSVDKAVISSPQKAQLILDGVFKYIDLLHRELSQLNTLKNR